MATRVRTAAEARHELGLEGPDNEAKWSKALLLSRALAEALLGLPPSKLYTYLSDIYDQGRELAQAIDGRLEGELARGHYLEWGELDPEEKERIVDILKVAFAKHGLGEPDMRFAVWRMQITLRDVRKKQQQTRAGSSMTLPSVSEMLRET